MVRWSSLAFVLAILVWPAYAVGWMPGGLIAAGVTSIGCLTVSYACYRVVRVRMDAVQIAELRDMQQREGMSDDELLRYVAVHHPNLDRLGKQLAVDVGVPKKVEVPQDQPVTVFPWIAWSEKDTVGTREMIASVFDKEPMALNGSEAGFLLEMLEAGRGDKGGMFLVVAKSLADGLEKAGTVSMDPNQRDVYGRQRLPEIAREIGLAEAVIKELGWDWPKRPSNGVRPLT
ncbi:MAG: hypothetical protein OXM56_08650 [Gammaproteobacteria bacterium]|nr:hypothetical protein [Gammaproteobacteria bacterium]MDE0349762.1 hypothetical protein [Gammaproteobacteria bacterium]